MKENKENIDKKYYGAKALIPVLIFIGLYIGCGIIFTFLQYETPFLIMSRYTAILISLIISLIYFEPHKKVGNKLDIYYECAGKRGIVLLGLIVIMAGGFSNSAEVIGGKDALVNIGLSIVPTHFIIPGIFILSAVISTCIGTSMGTLVAILPIACSLSEQSGLNIATMGAAAVTGAFFGDNLSMISDTTICATKGVGAEMKDKFKVNFYIAVIPAIITILLYSFIGLKSSTNYICLDNYKIETIFPYLIVLLLALKGLDVVMVLGIGIVSCILIGTLFGNVSFFEIIKAISLGMENMFWLAVFTTLVSGVIGIVQYYGGIDWLVKKIYQKIYSKKQCEIIICMVTMMVSAIIVNNTMAIIITSPVAKQLGKKYKVSPKIMASLLDIGACIAVMIAPHGSAVMMVQELSLCSYFEILKYQFYPFLLVISMIVVILLKKD